MDFLTQFDVIILSIATLILGMVILVKGGDWTISGAVEVARHYGMPPLLVGFTIVAFGTSLPELIASINANVKGVPGLAVGNVIGSNIANILLIGGVSALIAPLVGNLRALRNDLIMVFMATIAWFVALLYFNIDMMIGTASLVILIAYVVMQYQLTKGGDIPADDIMDMEHEAEQAAPKSHMHAVFMVIGGLIGLALGAELLIRGAVTTAKIMHIPDNVIGLTIIALGTSLPELTTCAIAAMKKHSDVIIGNLVGSNVFNLMMILGSMGLVNAYDMRDGDNATLLHQDMPIALGVTIAFIAVLMIFKRIPRIFGGIFLLGYIAYMVVLAMQTL